MFLMLAEVMRLWTVQRAFPGSGFWGFVAFHTTHAFATAAREGLDDDGIPDFVGFLFEKLRLLQFAVIAGYDGHTRFFHQRFGMMLEAHRTYG